MEASCYFCGAALTDSEHALGDGSCLECFERLEALELEDHPLELEDQVLGR